MHPSLKPLFVLICMTTALQAAKSPGTFLDIPWRANATVAKGILSKRPNLKISVNTSAKIVGEGGSFADQTVDHIDLEFQGEMFVTGTAYLTIPADKDKNGILLRDIAFNKLLTSLEKQYGKAPRSSDPNHTEVNWSWTTNEPLSSKKTEITIQLFYSWEPYGFHVRYANRPLADTGPNAPKTKDL